jgi:hypothetical protein
MGIFFITKANLFFASIVADTVVFGVIVTSHKPALIIRKSKIIFPNL